MLIQNKSCDRTNPASKGNEMAWAQGSFRSLCVGAPGGPHYLSNRAQCVQKMEYRYVTVHVAPHDDYSSIPKRHHLKKKAGMNLKLYLPTPDRKEHTHGEVVVHLSQLKCKRD